MSDSAEQKRLTKNAKNREYYQRTKNDPVYRSAAKRKYKANRSAILERCRQHYQANREAIRARQNARTERLKHTV